MAARKSKPEGRIPGSKNVERSRLVAAAPGEITPMHIELAHRLAMAELSDAQIATALGVSEATLNRWKTISPEFKDAIHSGKNLAIAPVVASLYEVAQKHKVERKKVVTLGEGQGVSHAEVVTYNEMVDGDVRAATHILACVLPETWALNRSRIDVETVEDVEREQRTVAALNALIGAPLKTLAGRRGS